MNPALHKFMTSEEEGVFIIGHASAIVRLGGDIILFDPVWGDYKPYGDHWHFFPKQIDCTPIIPFVDRVIISHEHADHLCEPVLKHFAGYDTPVMIMADRPRLFDRLRGLGLRVWERAPFQWHRLTGDVDVFFSTHAFNNIDSLPFLRSNTSCVSLGSDCFLDQKRIKEIHRAIPPIDVALVPYAFIHWWPFLQAGISAGERSREIARMVELSTAQANDFVRSFKPGMAIGTGADLYYRAPADHILNAHLFAPPPKFLERARAGDYVLLNHEPLGVKRAIFRNSEPEIYPNCQVEPLRFPVQPPSLSELQKLNTRLGAAREHRIKNFEIIVNDIVIDLEHLHASVRSWPGEKDYYRFDFDREQYRQWVTGKITFEQAIGTRRFQFEREPDTYRPDVFAWFQAYL